jgi:type I restriction enzyme, S subunit
MGTCDMPHASVPPTGWNTIRLGDVTVKVGSGLTPQGGSKVYQAEGHPFVRSQNVGWGTMLLDDLAFIDEETHRSFADTEIQQGDVLLNITGASIGRSTVADSYVVGGNVNQHVCIIRAELSTLNPQFLCSFLLSDGGQQQIESFQAGGNRQGLNFGQIRSFVIPLPSLPEQRAIAEVLSDVDALIAALDTLIAKKRAIKQGAMQALLTGKTRLPGFSGEWHEVSLKDIADIDVESLSSNTDREYSFNYISLEDVDRGILRGSTKMLFADAPSRARRIVRQNDILVSTVRPNLKSHLYVTDAVSDTVCSTGFSVVRCKLDIAEPAFVFYQLFSDQTDQQIQALLVGSNYPAINSGDVRKLLLGLPPLPEQRAIAAVLSDMDAEIDALVRRRDKTKALKQGMMQELLTGRTRLI